jgi:hypothetical protein
MDTYCADADTRCADADTRYTDTDTYCTDADTYCTDADTHYTDTDTRYADTDTRGSDRNPDGSDHDPDGLDRDPDSSDRDPCRLGFNPSLAGNTTYGSSWFVYDFVHLPLLLVYVPMPSARYLARKSPEKAVELNLAEAMLPSNVTLAIAVHRSKAILSMLVTLSGTALQFFHAYSLVCFITHKSIPLKELCQILFLFLFTTIHYYSLLFNKYDVISGVTFHITIFITFNNYDFLLPQTLFKNPLGRL